MFKQGDKVICVKDCEINSGCAKKDQIGVVNGDLDILTQEAWVCTSLNNWKLINKQMKTLDNLEVGDHIINSFGNIKRILARIDEIVALSYPNNEDRFDFWVTIKTLKADEYKLYEKPTEPEVKELTVKEISEKLGYEVKIIKE